MKKMTTIVMKNKYFLSRRNFVGNLAVGTIGTAISCSTKI